MPAETDVFALSDGIKEVLQAPKDELFAQLQTFSDRVLAHLFLPRNGSPHGQPTFKQKPHGVILHYTADPSLENVCRWFCSATSGSSAHFVVAKQKIEAFKVFEAGLLVATLPSTIMMLRPLDAEAYHATWANAWAYGIEIVNSGEVRLVDAARNSYVWWPADWTKPYTQPGEPWRIDGRFFEAYPYPQLLCVAVLTRALMQHMQSSKLWSVLGHECVQGVDTIGAHGHDKRDPSQALPVHLIRQCISDPEAAIPALYGYNSLWSLRQYRQSLFAQALGAPLQADLSAMPPSDIMRSINIQKLLLAYLGYHAEGLGTDSCPDSHTESVKVFQTMMGIAPDARVGLTTAMAFKRRIADRFFQPPAIV
jgi:N-acetyl-anhydromuramyl-L-alanine amidase AmpD